MFSTDNDDKVIVILMIPMSYEFFSNALFFSNIFMLQFYFILQVVMINGISWIRVVKHEKHGERKY